MPENGNDRPSHSLRDLPARTRNTAYALWKIARDRRLPYLGREELDEFRAARIRHLVSYAAETVPHYHEFFERSGLHPTDIRCADDLARLPLIDKAFLRDNPERLRSSSRRGREAVPFGTGGSTGISVTVNQDTDTLLEQIAVVRRLEQALGRLCGQGPVRRTLEIAHPGAAAFELRAFYREKTFFPSRPNRFFVSVEEPTERVIEMFNLVRPTVVFGYGDYLESLLRTITVGDGAPHLPRAFVYHSASMTPEGRRFIEETLGVPVLAVYNSTEAFGIAFSCEERLGLHLHEDLIDVRIVDEHGSTLPPGERGQVVISNLVNHGTVLLNYRLGDVAALLRERCACGRTFSLMSEVEGRIDEVLRLPDGSLVHPVGVSNLVRKFEGVAQFQLVQLQPARFELRVVPRPKGGDPSWQQELLANLRSLLKGGVVEATFHDALPPTPRGKHRRVIPLPPEGDP